MTLDSNIGDFINQYGNYQSKIKKITASVMHLFDLEYFLYTLVGFNGQIFAAGTEVSCLEFYFNKMLYHHDPILIDPKYIQNQISYLHSSMLDSPIRTFVMPFMNELQHDNILLFQEKNKLGSHHYIFATKKDRGCIINHYLNNIERIKIFISYFQCEVNPIIKKCMESTQINLYNLPNEFLHDQNFGLHSIHEKSANILCQKTDKIDMAAITSREWDCLKLSLQAKSSKECAKILGISHRTVEFHLENLKIKFHCANKKELISKSCFIFHDNV